MRLRGKVAIITGGALGIGRAAARLFAREGARVVIADINEELGNQAVAKLCEFGDAMTFVQTDVTSPQSVAALIDRTVALHGKLDVFYSNAGGSRPGDGSVTDAMDEAFWFAIKLDLYGTWLGARYAIPALQKAGGGSLITTCSMVALKGYPGMDAYTAAKGGIASLTRSMAVEYAPSAIRVNAVAPGQTLSERGRRWVDGGNMPERVRERHLLGLLKPEEIAAAALFLASDDSRHVTGQIFSIDSGYVIS